MQTTNTPNTSEYWLLFYRIQGIAIKEFPFYKIDAITDKSHKIAMEIYEILKDIR